jgi:hypothetical protein
MDNFRRYFIESCQTIASHVIKTDGLITYRRRYQRIISVGISQRVATQLQPMIITDGLFVGNYR